YLQRMDKLPFHKTLYFRVLCGILIGIAIGIFFPETGKSLSPVGEAFIKLIKMMIAPIIFCTVVGGIEKMGHMKDVGRVGLQALVYFEVMSTIALIIGLVVVNLLEPGAGINADPATLDVNAIASYTTAAKHQSAQDFLLNIIPNTMVDAFA